METKLTFSETQTDVIVTKESECQVLETAETSVQTDEVQLPIMGSASVDDTSLLSFLQRITPKVIEELERQQRSSAFEGYNPVDYELNTKAMLVHTLRWPELFSEGTVTGLSWSSTGSMIAVAYGADTHDTWCQHKAGVALWNINRCEIVSSSPEKVLDVSSCVPSVCFHPSNPAILALATRTGEVHIYDLSENEVVTPIATGYTGGSGITCLQWRQGEGGGEELIAATQGGHVLFWSVNFTKQSMNIISGVIIHHEDLPRSSRVGGSLTEGGEGVGITSLSFNSEDMSVFVAGVEGGGVVLCSTNIQLISPVTIEGVPCKRCVVSSLSGHSGRVTKVSFSPHHRNALVTLASDNQLKLHSLIQTHHPVVTLYSDIPLTTVQWSPARSVLLATTTTLGQVNFQDVCEFQQADNTLGSLTTNANKNVLLTLPSPEKTAPVSALAFNAANISLISTGDSLGRVFVWRLPTDVVSPKTNDINRLNALLSTAAQE